MSTFTKDAATKTLRQLTKDIEDETEADAATALADYIDDTYDYGQDSLVKIGPRNLYAEIALAYAAGYEHATGQSPRDLFRALRDSGLSV